MQQRRLSMWSRPTRWRKGKLRFCAGDGGACGDDEYVSFSYHARNNFFFRINPRIRHAI